MVIAIVTGVIVNYYNQLVSIRQKESLTALIEKLKILPELSKEELAEISDQIKKLN
jgi:voltage-gated potassium channel